MKNKKTFYSVSELFLALVTAALLAVATQWVWKSKVEINKTENDLLPPKENLHQSHTDFKIEPRKPRAAQSTHTPQSEDTSELNEQQMRRQWVLEIDKIIQEEKALQTSTTSEEILAESKQYTDQLIDMKNDPEKYSSEIDQIFRSDDPPRSVYELIDLIIESRDRSEPKSMASQTEIGNFTHSI